MILKAHNIVKKYRSGNRDIEILKGISLEVEKGDFLMISGRSGAGKSTLLYQLGLLDKPNSGEIEILNNIVTNWRNIQRTRFRLENLGYVFQNYDLIPELTAKENIALPCLMLGLGIKQSLNKAEKFLTMFNLEDKSENLPSQLSGGEQQRVSIARAIVNDAEIIFADEPTSSLDSNNAQVVMKTFKELSEKRHTIIMVSHEKEYYNFANKIIYLDDGRIVDNSDSRFKDSKQMTPKF